MDGRSASGGQFRHDLQLNPTANPRWKRANEFFLKQPGDPMPAVRDLFTPSKRFDQRNFLMCDHVIDVLHLEALARVKSKRDGNTTWFKAITDVESDGWLRIIHPSLVDDVPAAWRSSWARGSHGSSSARRSRSSELEVGDHVIVYNHPAYDKAKEAVDVWRLENALVVTTSPRLMLQGHGTNPLPFTSTRTIPVKDKATLEQSMRLNMLSLFNRKLNQLRRAARGRERQGGAARGDRRLRLRRPAGAAHGHRPLLRLRPQPVLRPAQEAGAVVGPLGPGQRAVRAPDLGRPGLGPADLGQAPRRAARAQGLLPAVAAAARRRRPSGAQGRQDLRAQEVTVSQKMASGWSWYYAKDESPDDGAPHRVAARRPKVS